MDTRRTSRPLSPLGSTPAIAAASTGVVRARGRPGAGKRPSPTSCITVDRLIRRTAGGAQSARHPRGARLPPRMALFPRGSIGSGTGAAPGLDPLETSPMSAADLGAAWALELPAEGGWQGCSKALGRPSGQRREGVAPISSPLLSSPLSLCARDVSPRQAAPVPAR